MSTASFTMGRGVEVDAAEPARAMRDAGSGRVSGVNLNVSQSMRSNHLRRRGSSRYLHRGVEQKLFEREAEAKLRGARVSTARRERHARERERHGLGKGQA